MEILICVLAACGVLTILWCLAGLVLFPVAGDDMVVVWRVRGACGDLEFRVRSYCWLRRAGVFTADLLLLDCGLCKQARECAEKMAHTISGVRLVYLAEGAAFRNGTDGYETDRTTDPARRGAGGDVSEPG